MLRSAVIDGWFCDEYDSRAPQRATVPMEKLPSDNLGVRLPGESDPAKIGPEAAELLANGEDLEVTVGWPEAMVVVRHQGAVIFAEGDVVHFGAMPLDLEHSIRRAGYEYLDTSGAEVKIELEMDKDDEVSTALLGPGETAQFGPYSIFHERSFDPSDRQSSLRQHSYFLRIRRRREVPATRSPHPDLLHPLDVESPAAVVALARRYGYLHEEEAMLAERAEFKGRLALYEGAAVKLEQAVRAVGPDPATLRRRAETVQVVTACLSRGERGQALIGRATILLQPTRIVTVSRLQLDSLPGRMRRTSTGS